MNKEAFLRISRWFGGHPRCQKALVLTEKLSVILFYIVYILLLALLLISRSIAALQAVLVPAAVFAGGSLLRTLLNSPRPYEVWQTTPLVPKDTRGKSFPSRHALSAGVITMAWLWHSPAAGAALLPFLLLVCLVRVLAGVHFVRDVAAGAAFGLLLGWIGFFLL